MSATEKRTFEIGNNSGTSGCFADMELYAVAAAMLFPNDEKRRKEYFCLGIDEVHSKFLDDRPSDRDLVMKTLGEVIVGIFSKEIEQDANTLGMMTGSVVGEAWRRYQTALRAARYSVSGKGSVQERIKRGSLAGLMLNLALLEDMNLANAAKAIENKSSSAARKEYEVFFSDMPTLSADNLQQNIWPEFKDAAHLWAAFQDFTYDPVGFPDERGLIRLSYLVRMGSVMVPNGNGTRENIPLAFWPSQYDGWKAFLWKANYIFEQSVQPGNRKYSSKPLLDPDTCWRFFV